MKNQKLFIFIWLHTGFIQSVSAPIYNKCLRDRPFFLHNTNNICYKFPQNLSLYTKLPLTVSILYKPSGDSFMSFTLLTSFTTSYTNAQVMSQVLKTICQLHFKNQYISKISLSHDRNIICHEFLENISSHTPCAYNNNVYLPKMLILLELILYMCAVIVNIPEIFTFEWLHLKQKRFVNKLFDF